MRPHAPRPAAALCIACTLPAALGMTGMPRSQAPTQPLALTSRSSQVGVGAAEASSTAAAGTPRAAPAAAACPSALADISRWCRGGAGRPRGPRRALRRRGASGSRRRSLPGCLRGDRGPANRRIWGAQGSPPPSRNIWPSTRRRNACCSRGSRSLHNGTRFQIPAPQTPRSALVKPRTPPGVERARPASRSPMQPPGAPAARPPIPGAGPRTKAAPPPDPALQVGRRGARRPPAARRRSLLRHARRRARPDLAAPLPCSKTGTPCWGPCCCGRSWRRTRWSGCWPSAGERSAGAAVAPICRPCAALRRPPACVGLL